MRRVSEDRPDLVLVSATKEVRAGFDCSRARSRPDRVRSWPGGDGPPSPHHHPARPTSPRHYCNTPASDRGTQPQGAIVSMDFAIRRVRVWYHPDTRLVTRPPRIG